MTARKHFEKLRELETAETYSPPSPERFFTLRNSASGTWYVLHLLAAQNQRAALVGVLRTLALTFCCVKCRLHLREYLLHFPVPIPNPDARQIDKAWDLFRWTCELHNTVTGRVAEETHTVRYQLGEEGQHALFRELTTQAEEDEIRYEKTGACEGCVR